MIGEFGSLPAVLAGEPARIADVIGRIDRGDMERINEFCSVLNYVLKYKLVANPTISNWRLLLDYLKLQMGYITVEHFRVLHLNVRNLLIRDELVSEGTIDHTSVEPREVIRRALNLGSASLILVHNHPSGDPSPSRSDISVTRNIIEAGKVFGIAVHDHLIISATGHFSFRSKGLM